MKNKKLFSSLCLAAMLSVPPTCHAQQNMHKVPAPFDRCQIARATNTPDASNRNAAASAPNKVITPAWEVTFGDEETFKLFEVINLNNDDGEWMFYKNWSGESSACYKYSAMNAADDWLISPKIMLEAGVNYDISFHAMADSKTYVERMEVKMLREASKRELDNGITILPPTELSGRELVTFVQKFTPAESGEYCVGFHAISDANQNRLLLYDVKVEKGAVETAPQKPGNFTATADPSGDLKARLAFNAPSMTMGGAALAAIDSVVVARNGEVIAVLNDVTPGGATEYDDDNVTLNGTNQYVIAAYNGADRGAEAICDVFVGVDLPVAPASFTITDNKTSIGAEWAKVTKGVNDGRFNPDKVTYKIYAFDEKNKPTIEVKDVLAETSTQIDMNTEEGEQHLQQYAVAASNTAGTGETKYSNALIVGKQYSLPFREGFSNGFQHDFEHFWWMDGEGNGYGYGMSVATFEKQSSDGDGSCMKLTTLGYNDKLNLNTGKIRLEQSDNLKLAFTYKTDGAPDARLNLMAIMPGGSLMTLGTYDIAEECDWKTAWVSLPGYMAAIDGLMFRFQLEATGAPSVPQTLYLDNVNIAVAKEKDINAGLVLPEKVQKGKDVALKVKLKNYGSTDAAEYTVVVKAAGKTVFDKTITETLPAFGYKEVPVTFQTSVVDGAESLPIKVEVTLEGDEDTGNNTAEGSVMLYDYVGNTVGELNGQVVDGGVRLTWNAPQPKVENITEDFENYEPWIIDNIGDWMVVDRDKNYVGGLFQDLVLPHEHEQYAFMVTNFEPDYNAGSYFPGHSGYSYLSSLYCINEDASEYMPNDNWLISPDLSGNAQTIKFFAINHDGPQDLFPENVNVLYSTTDRDPDSFIQIGGTHIIAGNEWEEVSVNLPEGALFFAIQSKNEAKKCNWLGIDDISFEKGTGNVKAYNVYRDGGKIGTVNDVTEFTDNAPLEGTHTYQITVIYANGNESAPASVSINTGTTGITSADDGGSNDTFDIYDMSGRIVRSNATSFGDLPRGVYVANGKKVIVR